MRFKKELQPLIKKARAQGWEISYTGSGHLCFLSPAGYKVFAPSTPSDHHSIRNVERKLKREGMII